MTDYTAVANRYIECWNESDPSARRQTIETLWAADGRYTDPLADVQGVEQIDATVAAVQAQFPHFRFRLAGPVDGHGNQCRFAWELGAVLTPEGKIKTVLGFLDRVPPAA